VGQKALEDDFFIIVLLVLVITRKSNSKLHKVHITEAFYKLLQGRYVNYD